MGLADIQPDTSGVTHRRKNTALDRLQAKVDAHLSEHEQRRRRKAKKKVIDKLNEGLLRMQAKTHHHHAGRYGGRPQQPSDF